MLFFGGLVLGATLGWIAGATVSRILTLDDCKLVRYAVKDITRVLKTSKSAEEKLEQIRIITNRLRDWDVRI